MFDHVLRILKDLLLAPVARRVGPWLAPNTISWIAFAVGMGTAAAVISGQNRLALGLWIGNRVLDGFDGTQARVHRTQTDFGGYVDIVLDFTVYAAIPTAIIAVDRTPGLALAGAVLLATFFVNAASWMYLSAILERRGAGAYSSGELTTVTMPPAIIAGTETFLFYALFFVVPGWRLPLFRVMSAFVGVNVVQRLWWARRRL